MKVIILETFEGYADGDDKPGRHFRPSEEAIEVADTFGNLIVSKGHARKAGAESAEPCHEAE